MSDQNRSDLPEGTDAIIEGAASTSDGAPRDAATNDAATIDSAATGAEDNVLVAERVDPAPRHDAQESGARPAGIADRVRSGGEKFASQAGDRARGFVTQGMERTAEALANVSKMVGDTAAGIEERLGPEYGDYARRAAGAIENAANSIAEKNPDELIDDTRNFVRNSPGIALAGAAVVGFVVARLLKSGIASTQNADEDDRD